MNGAMAWWNGRSANERLTIGIVTSIAVLATAGALAYAIATGGIVFSSWGTVIAAGAAASRLGGRA